MSNQTENLETIGHICATVQIPYAAVRRALQDIGAKPVLTINGIEHYAEVDVQRVAERLQRTPSQRQDNSPPDSELKA